MTEPSVRERYADTKREWDRMYDADADVAIWGEKPAVYVVERVAALWRADGARRILVLPCGDGRNIMPLVHEFPGIVAADASPNALSILRRRLAARGAPPIEVSVRNLFDTGFPGASFDAVLTWDVVSHLTMPREALAEMLRVLRPGGSLVINVFAADDENIRDDSMREIGPNELVSKSDLYYRAYERRDMEELVALLPVAAAEVGKIAWEEEPHQGYREYVHTHKGYVATLRK